MTGHRDGIYEVTRMVAHLTVVQCAPERCDDCAQSYRDRVLPLARSALGYRGMYLLVDRTARSLLALSLWDTGDDARAYEEKLVALVVGGDDVAAPIVCALYEVDAQA